MISCACAYSLVAGVRGIALAASESDSCLEDPLILVNRIVLQKDVLDTPEASTSERRDFGLGTCVFSARVT